MTHKNQTNNMLQSDDEKNGMTALALLDKIIACFISELDWDERSYDTDTYIDYEHIDSEHSDSEHSDENDVYNLLDREYDDYELFQAWLYGTAPTEYNPKESQWAHKC